jgi:hypothetical protein
MEGVTVLTDSHVCGIVQDKGAGLEVYTYKIGSEVTLEKITE